MMKSIDMTTIQIDNVDKLTWYLAMDLEGQRVNILHPHALVNNMFMEKGTLIVPKKGVSTIFYAFSS